MNDTMAEMLEESGGIESTTVGVYRTAATVKGGRRFSFSSLVVVGDRHGRVGLGYGKANHVPPAIEKAQKQAKRDMQFYPLQGTTLPHEVEGRFGACRVRLLPASPGTGVIAGAAVRAVLEMLGVQDCLTKSFGSNNPKNLCKAVFNGLDGVAFQGRHHPPARCGIGRDDGRGIDSSAVSPAMGTKHQPEAATDSVADCPCSGRICRSGCLQEGGIVIMMIHDITSKVGQATQSRKRIRSRAR